MNVPTSDGSIRRTQKHRPMGVLFPDATPLGLRVVAWILLGWLALRLWLFYRVYRRRIASLDRDWCDYCRHQATAEVDEEARTVTFSHIRDFTWRDTKDREEAWANDVVFDLNAIKDVWYIVDHFSKIKGVAHTMLTFEFLDGKAVTFSFEARRDASDRFSPWEGMWRAYELYLSIGFERDMIFLRTNARKHQVHRYRTTTSRRRERQLFMLLARRADELARKPEWYHSLSTSCATELRSQINKISPVRIPYVWRLLLPGHSPRMAYRLGLLQRWGTFEETRERSRVDVVAQQWDGEGDYSTMLNDALPSHAK